MTPRRTEVVARETLEGLIHEMADLMASDCPGAWGRIALIGSEIAHVGGITEDALTRRTSRVSA